MDGQRGREARRAGRAAGEVAGASGFEPQNSITATRTRTGFFQMRAGIWTKAPTRLSDRAELQLKWFLDAAAW